MTYIKICFRQCWRRSTLDNNGGRFFLSILLLLPPLLLRYATPSISLDFSHIKAALWLIYTSISRITTFSMYLMHFVLEIVFFNEIKYLCDI